MYVIPRYTPGSPAWVNDQTGLQVAKEEQRAIQGYLEGWYGSEAQALAERQGLEGIVIGSTHKGYIDMLTGRQYDDTPYAAIRYPEKLTCLRVKGVYRYWFMRQPLGQFRAKTEEGCYMPVLWALQQTHGMDIYSAETNELWRTRQTS